MACPHVAGTASGIDTESIVMTLDGANVTHTYDNATGIVSYVPVALAEDLHTVTLNVPDTVGKLATANWSFTINLTLPTEKTYFPSSVSITTGTVSSGGYSDLGEDDGLYLAVKSAKVNRRTQVIDWYSYVILEDPSKVTSLTITYDGKYSASRTQKLYIYNFVTESWEEIDSRTVGTSDTKITWSTTSPANYISVEGEIRLRVYASATRSFVCYADFTSYLIKYEEE